MAQPGFFHHIGTFLLFAATILLIITCITAPVVHDLAIMKVDLGSQSSSAYSTVSFGSFGYCIDNANGGDSCSSSEIGYPIGSVMNQVDNTQFSDSVSSTTEALTKAMVLHPISCGLNFIAFLFALGAGFLGSLMAALVAFVAFLVTCIIMIIDFVLFSIVRSNVNDNGTGASASYSVGAWTILASAICSLLGTIVLFLTCCSGRMHRRRGVAKTEVNDYGASTRRRRWF